MRIGRRSPSRLHALRFALRCLRLAVGAFPAFFPSSAWASGCVSRCSSLVGSSPTSVVAASTAHSPSALTSQSRGTPVKRLFSGHAASRGAPHFYVSPPGTHVTLCSIFQQSQSAFLRNARAYWLSGRHVRRSPFQAGCRPVRVFGKPLRARWCPTVGGNSVSSGVCTGGDSSGFGANSTLVFRARFTVCASKYHRENSAFFKHSG